MAIERFINNFQTTLSSGINDSTTTIPVAAGTSVASQFRARIDDEIIIVTAGGTGTSWTATRGAEGTSNVSHSSGATVTIVLTAGALQQMTADQVRTGTYADLPATSDAIEGHVYIFEDSIYDKAVFNGTSWDLYRGSLLCTPVVLGDFTRVNAGSETVDETNGGSLINFPATSTAVSTKMWSKTEPSAPYTVVVGIVVTALPGDYQTPFMVGWRNSSSGLVNGVTLVFVSGNSGWTYHNVNLSSPTVEDAGTVFIVNPILGYPSTHFFKFSVDATPNRHVFVSSTGLDGTWIEIRNVSHTTYVTPDQIIFGGHARNATYPVATWIFHWKET